MTPNIKSSDRRLKSYERILGVLRSGDPLSFGVIRDRLGSSSNATTGSITTAKKKGLVEKVERGVYRITEKGKEHLRSREQKEAQWANE